MHDPTKALDLQPVGSTLSPKPYKFGGLQGCEDSYRFQGFRIVRIPGAYSIRRFQDFEGFRV